MGWYNRVADDLGIIPQFIETSNLKLSNHRKDTTIHGNLEQNLSRLPGITETVWSELQEIEAILEYLHIQLRKVRSGLFKKYSENYNKALSSRDADKYIDGEEEVINFEILINDVALVRNNYLGIMKALETKGFQMSSIVKIRTAGMEDITL